MVERVKTDPVVLKQRAERVRDISEKVYCMRLENDCHGNVERMLEKDGDGGKKLRNRASAFDTLTRCYVEALEHQYLLDGRIEASGFLV